MEKPTFFICWACKNRQKILKKTIKKQCQFGMGKKRSQNGSKCGFGRVLGSIWEGLGRSGPSFGHFWMLVGRFFCVLNSTFFKHGSPWAQDGLQEASGIILSRFWKGLGKVLEGFGKVLVTFLKLFYVRTPALSGEAPRSVSINKF